MTEFLRKVTKSDIRNVLAIIVTIGCFLLTYLMLIKPLPPENKDILMMVVGFLFGGGLAGVVGYYFGSTKAEGDKAKKQSDDNA